MAEAGGVISAWWIMTVSTTAFMAVYTPDGSVIWLGFFIAFSLFGVFFTAMCYNIYLQRRKNYSNNGA
jgi:hypothetical protein